MMNVFGQYTYTCDNNINEYGISGTPSQTYVDKNVLRRDGSV